MRKIWRTLISLWLVSLVLTGCGFHLAGNTPLLPELHVLYIKARTPYDPFNQMLRHTLLDKGAIIVDHPDKAPITLAILEKSIQIRNMGVQSNNFYANQIFTLTVVYQLQTPDGYPITVPRTIVSDSTPQIHKTAIQGVNEDKVLKDALRQDAILRMFDQLNSPLTLDTLRKFQRSPKPKNKTKTSSHKP